MSRLVGTNDRGYRVGSYHQNAKIPDEAVEQARDLHDSGTSLKAIAALLGLTYRTVCKLVYYERRAQLPTRWIASRQPEDRIR